MAEETMVPLTFACRTCGAQVQFKAKTCLQRTTRADVILEIPAGVPVPTCTRCGQLHLDLVFPIPVSSLAARLAPNVAPEPLPVWRLGPGTFAERLLGVEVMLEVSAFLARCSARARLEAEGAQAPASAEAAVDFHLTAKEVQARLREAWDECERWLDATARRARGNR